MIYLDYAASAPVKPEVEAAIKPYLSQKFGNPSSPHSFGQEARAAVDQAREKIALFLNCEPREVIFTSGGTESDNLAIQGVINASKIKKPHVITSQIEHHAVLHTIAELEKQGKIEATYVGVDRDGKVSVEEVKAAIKPNTILISIMYANNETGVIQPIREIGKMIERIKNQKSKLKTLFHTDAVQAAGYLNCDTKYLHIDLLSLSGHKLGAPKGIGVLFIKKGTPISPMIFGGVHERNLRAGTENVPGIVALGEAVELVKKSESDKIKKLRDYLESEIIKRIPAVKINGDIKNRLPNISNLSFKNVEGESIILSLDLEGVAVTTGSACTSGTLEPSHVLMAMYHNPIRAHSSVRFSLGWATTKEEIDQVIKKLPHIIKRLRVISPFKNR